MDGFRAICVPTLATLLYIKHIVNSQLCVRILIGGSMCRSVLSHLGNDSDVNVYSSGSSLIYDLNVCNIYECLLAHDENWISVLTHP